MVTIHGERVVAVNHAAEWLHLAVCSDEPNRGRLVFNPWKTCLPDFSDAATLGCLLALVRKAWGDERASANASPYGDGRWGVVDSNALRFHAMGATEREALVAALEAAP